MRAHLREISRNVAPGAHAVLLLDRAGWHTTGELKVPNNITLLFLPSRAPELNPVENLWQFLRQTTSPTAPSRPIKISSMPPARLGTASSISLGKSCPSDCANGPTTVNPYDRWYQIQR